VLWCIWLVLVCIHVVMCTSPCFRLRI
jgi:hypothetical protein